MPTRMRQRFAVEDLQKAVLSPPLPNTKGCPVLKVRTNGIYVSPVSFGSKLFDLSVDPRQKHPIDDAEMEARIAKLLVSEMKKADAPIEQYERLGLPSDPERITTQIILDVRVHEAEVQTPEIAGAETWTQEAKNAYRGCVQLISPEVAAAAVQLLPAVRQGRENEPVTLSDVVTALKKLLSEEEQQRVLYFLLTVSRAD